MTQFEPLEAEKNNERFFFTEIENGYHIFTSETVMASSCRVSLDFDLIKVN